MLRKRSTDAHKGACVVTTACEGAVDLHELQFEELAGGRQLVLAFGNELTEILVLSLHVLETG